MGSIVSLSNTGSVGIIFYAYLTYFSTSPGYRCFVLWPDRKTEWYDEDNLIFLGEENEAFLR